MTVLNLLAEYGAAQARQPLSDEVIHHAKRAMIDWLSALYPGTRIEPAILLARAHAAELGLGASSLPGFNTTAFAALAAWINGSASHSVEFDDIFRDAVYHPGCPTIAAALAVAEQVGADGARLLNALTIGYEISTRVGSAVQPSHYRFFHPTGTVGCLGAAAAVAALLAPGDAVVMANALANATTFASGLQQGFRSDSMTKPLHAGHAALVGVQTGMAAAHGVTGPPDMLDGAAGFGAALSSGADWARATEGLGSRYNIMSITQKNHGCCGHTFSAIDAALVLRNQQQVDWNDIEAIAVDTYQAAIDVAGNPAPRSAAEAKFSIAYVVSHAWLHGSVRLDAFSPERLQDQALRGLMRRVTVTADAVLTAAFPGQRAARLTVITRDGRRLQWFQPHRKGDPELPLDDREIDAKFIELAAPVIGAAPAASMLARLWRLEHLPLGELGLLSRVRQ